MTKTENTRIKEIRAVATPTLVADEFPMTEEIEQLVINTRNEIHQILQGEDDRILVVVGPCSIHDPKAAIEYAQKLLELRNELKDDLVIVMRVYFEKPRTTVGWKGLINDPDLNHTFHINKGIKIGRELLIELNKMGMPAGTEFLDLMTPQYLADLVSWGAIGARTTESQSHREMTSGLSCPVGLKNGTDGNLKIASDAILAAARPHHFLSMTSYGHSAIFTTMGNEDCHVILRGGKTPNYDAQSVAKAVEMLNKAGVNDKVMVDFSHANSLKEHKKQISVGSDVSKQIAAGDKHIMGVMIESHLVEGNQKISDDMVYGQSITDACISFDDTVNVVRELAQAVAQRRKG